MKRFSVLLLLFLLPLSLAAQKVSHIRIVRISLVSGTAEMNQQDGRGWHKALLNAPISERTELRTGPDGRVAVEFEDASLIELPPSSQVDFTTLSLVNGVRQNVVTLARGTAFFSLHKHDSDGFAARFPGGFATLPDDKAWFRVDLGGAQLASDSPESAVALQASVRVLNGKVEVQSPDQVYIVKKHEQLTLHAAASAELVKNKNLDALDQWSQQLDAEAQVREHKLHNAPGYGLAELSSYGTWSGGYWYPNVAAGWSPYSNGNWFWDPMMGYTWVSSYPWGWLPYHYGQWMMGPGGQWYWAPGSYWNYTPQPVITGGGSTAVARPPIPMPPTHRRTITTPQPAVRSGALVRSNGAVRAGLPMPPVNVHRVVLPPAARQRMTMPMNAAQRAAMARANQSRREEILRQQWRMQSGIGVNRAEVPAQRVGAGSQRVNSPRMNMPAAAPRTPSAPRMAPMPQMGPRSGAMPRMEPAPRMSGPHR